MKYEGAFIFETPDEIAESGMTKVKTLLEKNGAKISSEKKIGQKAFTSPIKKKSEGFYFHYILDAPATFVADIRKDLGVEPGLLRYLVVRSRELRLRRKRGRPKRDGVSPEASKSDPKSPEPATAGPPAPAS